MIAARENSMPDKHSVQDFLINIYGYTFFNSLMMLVPGYDWQLAVQYRNFGDVVMRAGRNIGLVCAPRAGDDTMPSPAPNATVRPSDGDVV